MSVTLVQHYAGAEGQVLPHWWLSGGAQHGLEAWSVICSPHLQQWGATTEESKSLGHWTLNFPAGDCKGTSAFFSSHGFHYFSTLTWNSVIFAGEAGILSFFFFPLYADSGMSSGVLTLCLFSGLLRRGVCMSAQLNSVLVSSVHLVLHVISLSSTVTLVTVNAGRRPSLGAEVGEEGEYWGQNISCLI